MLPELLRHLLGMIAGARPTFPGLVRGDDGAVAVLHGRGGAPSQGAVRAEGEGAERASYALKLLQSEGSLTISSPGKDPVSGKIVTHD